VGPCPGAAGAPGLLLQLGSRLPAGSSGRRISPCSLVRLFAAVAADIADLSRSGAADAHPGACEDKYRVAPAILKVTARLFFIPHPADMAPRDPGTALLLGERERGRLRGEGSELPQFVSGRAEPNVPAVGPDTPEQTEFPPFLY